MLLNANSAAEVYAFRQLSRMFASFDIPAAVQMGKAINFDPECVRQALFQFSRLAPHVEYTPDRNDGSVDLPVKSDEDYTHTTPRCFILPPWRVPVKNWADLVQETCGIVSIEHRDVFESLEFKVYGERRQNYFSRYADSLTKPRKVFLSDLFVETNLSANNAAVLFKHLAFRFGYDEAVIDAVTR